MKTWTSSAAVADRFAGCLLGLAVGDDTDTVAAMTGALVGAFAGTAAIPPALLAKLEDGPPKGRSHITSLAAKLFEVRSSANPRSGC